MNGYPFVIGRCRHVCGRADSGENAVTSRTDKAPSMYEMEGALPGYATPSPPVARQTPHHAPPAGTGYPLEVPVSRRFPRPGDSPGRFPFPTVKVFLLLSPSSRKSLGVIHFEFFPVHMISTDHRRLSAHSGDYPRLIHRLVHSSSTGYSL